MMIQTDTQKEDLLYLLSKQSIEIIFEKIDGTERKMVCSLESSILPERKSLKERKQNPDIIHVWEIDSGWKSIRWKYIKEWRLLK